MAPADLFPRIAGTSDWQYVRETENHYSNGPVTDVGSDAIRCYQLESGSENATTYGVKAGGTISFDVAPGIYHPGALSAYMAKAPSGETAETFDGSGTAWFKVYQDYPTISNSGMTWPSEIKASISFQIPSCLENGDYLFRVEHVALHSASTVGGAQSYLSCAQVSVTGGSGSGRPTNLVAFPGAYQATDPGILINIYSNFPKTYTPAWPSVFTC